MIDLDILGEAAFSAAQELALTPTKKKNQALQAMAQALREGKQEILKANTLDLESGRELGLTESLLDRLKLNPQRIEGMAVGLEELVRLPDPVGVVTRGWQHPQGMDIRQVRVPLGLIGVIYEARPNVTADAIGLCLKSGNGVMLKGGKEAENSNQILSKLLREAAYSEGIPPGCIQQLPGERSLVEPLIRLKYLALLIPRGGAGLISYVTKNATVPVLETGVGNCHIYVDKTANLAMAEAILLNAKVQRPSVCNAAEKLLIHQDCVETHLKPLVQALQKFGVTVLGCESTRQYLPGLGVATAEDWYKEYSDLMLAVKIVDSTQAAIDWINRYGSQHSEAIITESYRDAQLFCSRVDAAAVYVNASTRFTDGFEFGFGAEIGIATQRLHARGPVGLPELTTTKYIIQGDGQIRS